MARDRLIELWDNAARCLVHRTLPKAIAMTSALTLMAAAT